MVFRRQPPVFSPLSLSAVLSAFHTADPRARLSAALAARLGVRHALLAGGGTDALLVALRLAAQRRPGLAVALPGYACYDLATAAIGAGVPVRLYDLDPRTLAPEAASLSAALSGGVAALVVVHLFGVPVPMDAMRTAAREAGALLIEDAAQGAGGSWRGRPLGGAGDMGVLSFGRGKGVTGGGGGALLVRQDDGLAAMASAQLGANHSSVLAHGVKLAAQWMFGRPSLFGIPNAIPALRLGETIYRPPTQPREMSPAAARVLVRTIERSEHEAVVRRRNAADYLAALGARASRVTAEPPPDAQAGWLRFPVRLRADDTRDRMAGPLGVSRAYPLPLREVAALHPLLEAPVNTPGADVLARTLRTIPTHSFLTPRERDGLLAWIADGDDP